jgi:hypothetical protein
MWNPFSDTAKGAVEGLGDAVAKAVGAFIADPTKVQEFTTAVMTASLAFQTSVITTVNTTMQAEAKSEHWLQWSWRPIGAFIFYFLVVHNFVLASYFAKWGLVPLSVPESVWYAFLALLGVAAYTRGMNQIEQTKKS